MAKTQIPNDEWGKLREEYNLVRRDADSMTDDCIVEKSEVAYKDYQNLRARQIELESLLGKERFEEKITALFWSDDLWSFLEVNSDGSYRTTFLNAKTKGIISENIFERKPTSPKYASSLK